MLPIQIVADPAEVEDFRSLTGDYHFEQSIIDAGVGHLEAAFKRALGSRLLKFQLTNRGRVQWYSDLIPDTKKTVRTAIKTGGLRIVGIRPVIDVSHDDVEEFEFLQDVSASTFSHKIERRGSWGGRPFVKVKMMKKWKRLSISFVDVDLPVHIFPWANTDIDNCNCPECAITPRLNNVVPTFICSICGDQSWCSCMDEAVHKLSTRENYNTSSINQIMKTAKSKKNVCHLCRGVPVTTIGNPEKGLKGLMFRYHSYRNVAAVMHDWDWKKAENSVRERLGIPNIGEGWINEAMLLRQVISLLPNEEVIHQGSPEWLGRQRFDIWLPNLKIAIEYNGEQHYSPIALFGGVEGFNRTVERDEQKRRLARENGVRLIEIPYHDMPSVEKLSKMIKGI